MIKLKKLLKEELSKGEQFGIKEAASNIVSLHKQLNAALLKFTNGTKKMASKHKDNKDLKYLYQSTKGNYYYAIKKAAGENFGGGSWGKLITKLLGKNSLAQALGEGKLTEGKTIKYKQKDWKKYDSLHRKGKMVAVQTAYGDEFTWDEADNDGVWGLDQDGRQVELTHDEIDVVMIF